MLSLQLLRSTVASFFLANIAAVMLSNAASYTTLNSSQIQGILDTTATTASNLQLTHLSITQHGTRSDADYFGHSPLPTSGNVSEFLLNSTFVQGSHQSLAVSQAITATTKRPIDSYTLWLSQCAVAILTYGSPFLIALATVGNTLSVIVLRHPTFRKSSTSFILSALAVGDAVLVDIGLMRQWISYAFNIDIRLFSSFGCKLHVFLVYFLTMLSPWTLVLLTAERLVSVSVPLKCRELCSIRRIFVTWCAVFVLLFGCNFHFFFTFDLNVYKFGGNRTSVDCGVTRPYSNFFSDQWYWIDACVRNFIPFGLIFAGNIFIICRVVAANRLRRGQMQLRATESTDGVLRGNKITSFTVTLIVVSVTFLVLNVPADVYFLLLANGRLTNGGVSSLFYSALNLALYTNYSINFLMYFVSGRKFRVAALDMVTCRLCRRGGSHLNGKSTAAGRLHGTVTGKNGVSRTENTSMNEFTIGTPSGGSRCHLNG